ncbi:MAG: carbohydrate ABC transporter permease, partial [Chloroflexi bacterium]|nr:carbohydrate ABC transporter permease [Chloroflexota bacterium]
MIKKLFTRNSIFELSPADKLLVYSLLIFWAVIVLFPLYWLFITGFKLPIDVNSGPFYLPFVDFRPSLHAWGYVFGEIRSETVRPFVNTVSTGLASTTLAIFLGSAAAYALARFKYRPRVGAILAFIGCLALVVVAVVLGLPWPAAVLAGIVLFIVVLQTIGKRFKRSLANSDIAFWLISQRMLPPVAVVIPIYVLFQQLKLLDTLISLIITYV